MSAGDRLVEPDLVNNGDQLEVQGLIGVDILQFFSEFRLVSCMLGSAWKVPSGIVPFGNVLHFLHSDQVVPESSSVRQMLIFLR